MIYETDIHEASEFFPTNGEVILVVNSKKLLPYVRRELTRMYGMPSTTGEVYSRYNGLKVFTLVTDTHMLQDVLKDTNAPMYYVRERGERMEPLSQFECMINDLNLACLCLPESDAILYVDNKYPTWGRLYHVPSELMKTPL